MAQDAEGITCPAGSMCVSECFTVRPHVNTGHPRRAAFTCLLCKAQHRGAAGSVT